MARTGWMTCVIRRQTWNLVAAGSVALMTASALPTSAAATTARPIGQLAESAGKQLTIESVSGDGRHVLLEQRSSSPGDPGETLWALDATTGASRQLAALPLSGRYSQSPAGDWAAWVTKPSARSCPRPVHVARTDGSEPPRRLVLPGAYARYAVNGVTVGAGGRVTVRVGPCRNGFEPSESRAILTADPGSASFRVLASSRSGYSDWPVSQDGRVFAVCAPVVRRKSGWTSQITVVDSRDGLSVSRARLSTNLEEGPYCVASNAGTATMMVIRARKAAHRFTNVGVTVGGRGTPRFSLPGGTRDHGIGLEAVSPDGTQVVTRFDVPEATVIDTASGRYSRSFRPPDFGGTWTHTALQGMPALPWSPFAPAVVVPARGSVGMFDPRTQKTTRVGRVVPRFGGLRTTCFLPSGRVLLAAVPDRRLARQELFVTDARRARALPIDSSAIGTVTSISCDAAAAGKVFAASADTGRVYELAANDIDGSPLQ